AKRKLPPASKASSSVCGARSLGQGSSPSCRTGGSGRGTSGTASVSAGSRGGRGGGRRGAAGAPLREGGTPAPPPKGGPARPPHGGAGGRGGGAGEDDAGGVRGPAGAGGGAPRRDGLSLGEARAVEGLGPAHRLGLRGPRRLAAEPVHPRVAEERRPGDEERG